MHCCKSTTTVTSQLQWQSKASYGLYRVYCESNVQFDNNLLWIYNHCPINPLSPTNNSEVKSM